MQLSWRINMLLWLLFTACTIVVANHPLKTTLSFNSLHYYDEQFIEGCNTVCTTTDSITLITIWPIIYLVNFLLEQMIFLFVNVTQLVTMVYLITVNTVWHYPEGPSAESMIILQATKWTNVIIVNIRRPNWRNFQCHTVFSFRELQDSYQLDQSYWQKFSTWWGNPKLRG